MSNAKGIAERLLVAGLYPELTSDDVQCLAREYLRLHEQRAAGEGDIQPPPADPQALRRSIEDILDPPEDRQP